MVPGNRLLPSCVLALVSSGFLASFQLAAQPLIRWTPEKVTQNQFAAGDTVVVTFESSADLGRVRLRLSASLSDYMTIRALAPAEPFAVAEGDTVAVEIKLKEPLRKLPHTVGGTLHVVLSPSRRPAADPLNLGIRRAGDREPLCSALTWSAEGFAEKLLATGRATLAAQTDCAVTDVVFWVSPSLQGLLSVAEPTGPVDIPRRATQNVTIQLNASLDLATAVVAGALHARSGSGSGQTYPMPYPINLGAVQEEQEEVAPGIVVSAASYQAGPVAPGEIVTIFGTGLGPEQLTTLRVGGDGKVANHLADTMVLFDGLPAPLIHARSNQVSVAVPFGVAGKPSVDMLIAYQGKTSALFLVPIAPAGPALFSMDASGSGQGAILNQNLTLNSFNNPAREGSVVVLFGTGAGLFQGSANEDGQIVGDSLPLPELPVSARIGGVSTDVLYAGGAPGLINAVIQMNVRIPVGAPTGTSIPVEISVGEFSSGSSITLAVQ